MKKNKVCLITGGAKRIGEKISYTLAKDGWDIAIHYNKSIDESLKLKQKIEKLGNKVMRIQADFNSFTDENFFFEFMDSIQNNLGPINMLVNNAAVFNYDSPSSTSIDGINNHIINNTIAPVMLTKVLYKMRSSVPLTQDPDIVINLLDQKLWNPNPDFFSYTLSKSALREATELMARSFAPYLRVLAIAPGITLPTTSQNSQEFEDSHKKTPLGYSSSPEDIADSIVWLSKAKSITGTTIIIDGGQHLIPSPRDVVFMKS